MRKARGENGPDLTTVRRALRGETHKRGRVETRGRKTKLTAVKLQALDRARKKVAKKVKGEAEVHMKDIMKEVPSLQEKLRLPTQTVWM